MAGVDLFTVKEILGPQDITTTMRYSHLSPVYLQDAVNRGSLIETENKTGRSPSEDTHEQLTAHGGLTLFGEILQALNLGHQLNAALLAPGSPNGYALAQVVTPLFVDYSMGAVHP